MNSAGCCWPTCSISFEITNCSSLPPYMSPDAKLLTAPVGFLGGEPPVCPRIKVVRYREPGTDLMDNIKDTHRHFLKPAFSAAWKRAQVA